MFGSAAFVALTVHRTRAYAVGVSLFKSLGS